jgi:hypothetical protein
MIPDQFALPLPLWYNSIKQILFDAWYNRVEQFV